MTTTTPTAGWIARSATVANGALAVGLLLLVATALLRVNVSGDSILDVPAFVLAMSWLLATPVTVVTAAVASRRAGWRPGQWSALAGGVLWCASVAYLATLH